MTLLSCPEVAARIGLSRSQVSRLLRLELVPGLKRVQVGRAYGVRESDLPLFSARPRRGPRKKSKDFPKNSKTAIN